MKTIKIWIFACVALLFCSGHLQARDGNPKTLVLIICSDNLPVYKGLQRSWRSYMHSDPEHFECYFIRSDTELSTDFAIQDDIIWSKGQESLRPGLLNKTLLSLEAMESRLSEFDYVLRANLSSFYVFPRLLSFLKYAPRQRFYCGIHHGGGTPGHEAGWVCGAGILMSTDLARMLIANKPNLFNLSPEQESHADDVAIADLFAANGIRIQPGLFREIYSYQDWMKVQRKFPTDVFHFRIITPPPTRAEVDLLIHQTLLQMIYNKTVSFDDCH